LSYSFRLRFVRSPNKTINLGDNELTIPAREEGLSIVLRARGDGPIRDSDNLLLLGAGFGTEEDAWIFGTQYENALKVALARVRVGGDFGGRPATGLIPKQGLDMAEEQSGVRALNDVHGLMVFPSDRSPSSIRSTGNAGSGSALRPSRRPSRSPSLSARH